MYVLIDVILKVCNIVELCNLEQTDKTHAVQMPCPSQALPTPVASATVTSANKGNVGRVKSSTVIKSAPTSALLHRVLRSSSSGMVVPTPRRYDPFEADYDIKALVSEF